MRHMVIGIGEVGGAVWANLSAMQYDVTPYTQGEKVSGKFDILHICFPPSKTFVKDVKDYQKRFKADYTIIYASTPVGTTKQIPNAAHSPIEGIHPKLKYSVKKFLRWVGYNDIRVGRLAQAVWEPLTEVKLVENSDYTEFLKLASTSKYGINIVWAQYMADTAEKMGMDYSLVKEWDVSYNQLYKKLNYHNYRKYVLDPPKGPIGGHCIVPNAEILSEQYPHDMLDMIKKEGI